MRNMKIKFCGAAQAVTGSCHLLTLENGYTILMDAGLYQGRKKEFNEFNRTWLFNPAEIDCMVLSHAHIDHCGRIPKLVKDGFKGSIFCTKATKDLAAMMLIDSAKIQERDAYYSNKRRKQRGEPQDVEPIYVSKDVEKCIQNFVGLDYDKSHRINNEVSVKFRDNGHILGSASITLSIKTGPKAISIGFTGDIGKPDRAILKDPIAMDDLDYLLCESTYGARVHKKKSDNSQNLLNIINETCVKNKGKLLIPAFSVGRHTSADIPCSLREHGCDPIIQVAEHVALRKLPKSSRRYDIHPRVDAGGLFSTQIEAFADAPHAALCVDPDRPEGARSGVVAQQQCDGVPAGFVLGDKAAQVGVEQHVAAEDQAGVALAEEVGHAPDTAAGVEQFVFEREPQRHARRLVALRGVL